MITTIVVAGTIEHERMLLVGADRDAFLIAVTEPPKPTERLVAALKRHREMTA
jgi:uncharacterized protein (DUF1778 family)